jgi:uncharacterized protein with PQ loop repeat
MIAHLTSAHSALDTIMLVITIIGAICLAIFTLPNLVTTIKNQQTQLISYFLYILLGVGAFSFSLTSYYNAFKGNFDTINFIIGFSNMLSGSSSFILVYLKTKNIKKANQKDMTEKKYCLSLLKDKKA